jgi:hypothetical protein
MTTLLPDESRGGFVPREKYCGDEAAVFVNEIGKITACTLPGLNRHVRSALKAALSKIALPVLCRMPA